LSSVGRSKESIFGVWIIRDLNVLIL
jgi:hypothetical protein